MSTGIEKKDLYIILGTMVAYIALFIALKLWDMQTGVLESLAAGII
ncbi:MAG: hypothetical protein ACKKL5_04135 [Candidatus Komeilibacteria bacterium]